jgi:hypothetical protein
MIWHRRFVGSALATRDTRQAFIETTQIAFVETCGERDMTVTTERREQKFFARSRAAD